MTSEEAIKIINENRELFHSLESFTEALNLAIKALKNDIIPVIIKDGDYEFDGLLDNNRQLLYGQSYTAEYVKDVLGMSWRGADNENGS